MILREKDSGIESFEKASFWRLFKAISERFDSYLMVFQTYLSIFLLAGLTQVTPSSGHRA